MRVRNPMVIHYVRDMGRACAFYRDILGLPEEPTPGSGSPGWNTFRCDGLIVALHILPPGDSAEGPLPHAGLNLQVDDLDSAIAEVRAAGGTVRAVQEAGGGVPVRVAEVTDPDGNGFELRQHVG
ncbi:MAG: VOC family protein [Chloroflexota bacterium]|nr:VOC family protein [Chloroflexota bacterium]